MNNRTVIIFIAAILVSYAFGRFSVNPPATKTTTDVKVDTQTHANTDTKKQTVIKKLPTGEEVTVITEDTTIRQDDTSSTKSLTTTSIIPVPRKTLNLSVMAGTRTRELAPIYGVSVSKEFIGPVTAGVFYLTNGTLGLSVGLNF